MYYVKYNEYQAKAFCNNYLDNYDLKIQFVDALFVNDTKYYAKQILRQTVMFCKAILVCNAKVFVFKVIHKLSHLTPTMTTSPRDGKCSPHSLDGRSISVMIYRSFSVWGVAPYTVGQRSFHHRM